MSIWLPNRLDIVNSTISGSRNGVGLYLGAVFSAAGVSIRQTTIIDNDGGGVDGYAGASNQVGVQNAIVAGNGSDGGSDLLRMLTFNLDYSLIGDPGDADIVEPNPGSNLFGLDPLLGPLQDNGGPTLTHALLPDSPALDRGDPAFAAPPEFDQRGPGFARVSGGRLDLGAYELQTTAPGGTGGRLLSLGDVDGDGDPDLAVLAGNPAGQTMTLSVRDARHGTRLRNLVFDAAQAPLDLAVMPDHDGNGAPELALLRVLADQRVRVEVHDSLHRGPPTRVPFDPAFTPRRLAVVPDRNGAAALAVLGTDPVSGRAAAEVRDGRTGQWQRRVFFAEGFQTVDFAVLPAINGYGRAALAHLGRNGQGQTQVELRDAASGARLRTLGYPQWATPLALAEVPDTNGNARPEVAVLGWGATAVTVKTTDSRTADPVGFVAFNANFTPHQLRVLPDTDHNGTPELVVLGRNAQGQLKADIRDTVTGALVRNVWFGTLAPLDLAVLPGPWLAVLGTTPAGASQVLIKDAVTKAPVSVIDLE